MKTFINLILSLGLLNSCAIQKGDRNTGKYSSYTLGTNYTGYQQSPDQLSFESSNQSQVALSAIRTTGTIASAWIAMKGLLGLSDNSTKEVTNASDNALKAHQSSEATKRAALNAIPSTALP